VEAAVSVVGRIDRFQQRHSWAGFPLAVVYKYFEDQGAYLAALITYYGFLSIFPLLLLLVTSLGYVLEDNPHLRQDVLDSALGQFPGMAQQIGDTVRPLEGNLVALIVGIVGGLYGAIGVAQAVQNALNRMWAIPRNSRPNPLMARLRSLLFLLVVGTALLTTTAITALTTHVDAFGANLGFLLRALIVIGTVALNSTLFVATFRVLTARDVTIRQVLLGAVIAATGWQLLQWLGDWYVQRVEGSNNAYGIFAIVLGLVGYIFLAAVVVVLATEINVVRVNRLWPRSLLTPFTDNVTLTDADRRAYQSYARSERFKGFQHVEVDFDQPPTPANPPDAKPDGEADAKPDGTGGRAEATTQDSSHPTSSGDLSGRNPRQTG
jgi:YihY family inner membrane protein